MNSKMNYNDFVQPCHIKKNTKQLREKLKNLGYVLNHGKAWGKYLATFITNDTKEWRFVASPEYDLKNNPDINVSIDCGDNEDLFLALAALRKGTHLNQWHVCIRDYITPLMKQYKVGDWSMCAYEQLSTGQKLNWRKATVKEILEHFK